MAAKYGSGYTDTGRRGGRWTCQCGLAQGRLANFAAQLKTFTWCLFLLRGDYLGDTEELLGIWSIHLFLLLVHGKYPAIHHILPWLPIYLSPQNNNFYEDWSFFISPGFVKNVWCASLANNISCRKYCTGSWQCNLKSWSLVVCGPVFSLTRDLVFCLVAEETWGIWSNCFDGVQLGNRTFFARKCWYLIFF